MIKEEEYTKKFHSIIPKETIIYVIKNLRINSSIHGIEHWSRVLYNGFYLSDYNGADKEVIAYFALFHDCQRYNDHTDAEHGERGAKFFESLYTKTDLKIGQFDKVIQACAEHNLSTDSIDLDIGTCFDADRLDLKRVGITLKNNFLSTDIAKEKSTQLLLDDQGISTFNMKTLLSNSIYNLYNEQILRNKKKEDDNIFSKLKKMLEK